MEEIVCPYTRKGAVQCFEFKCEHCGWNPETVKRRKMNLGLKQNANAQSIVSDEKFGQWVDYNKKKPKNGQMVITYNANCYIQMMRYSQDEGCFIRSNGDRRKLITHWMELPEPPEVTK